MMKNILIATMMTVLSFLACPGTSWANNILVENISLENYDSAANTVDIEFDIGWDNSWRASGAPSSIANWDAAWVFAKYQVKTAGVWGDWNHCTLLNTGYAAPAGSTFSFGATGGVYKGVFIYRSSSGAGSVDWNNARIRWNYGANSVADGATVRVKVFAVEMVYVPEGPFYIGDTDASVSGSLKWQSGAAGAPQITSSLSNAINCVNTADDDAQLEGAGVRIDGDGGLDSNADGTIDNPNFPTGYKAFYLMKYEVTQGQYRDFLNTLTRTQQNNRTAAISANRFAMSDATVLTYRSAIRAPASIPAGVVTFGCDYDVDGTFDESTDGEWIGMNYFSLPDLLAYADWAALRPFTELEFEKAARGPAAAINDEYPWGTATLTDVNTLNNAGTSSEVPTSTGAGLCNASGGPGPFRVGFAATASTTRETAAAGYYGAMELAGNVYERVVTLGESSGRAYDGSHGDGVLSTNGYANQSTWPGLVAGEVTMSAGAGFRGSGWGTGSDYHTSNREYGSYQLETRRHVYGGRCARTAP